MREVKNEETKMKKSSYISECQKDFLFNSVYGEEEYHPCYKSLNLHCKRANIMGYRMPRCFWKHLGINKKIATLRIEDRQKTSCYFGKDGV